MTIRGFNEEKNEKDDFELLVKNVEHVHSIANTSATCVVNQLNTVRNWAIGYYIVEFEQHGNNRAAYGEKLLKRLEERLNIKGLDRTMSNLCRIFCQRYSQMCETVSHKFQTPPEQLISKLSFSHIREIMSIDDSLLNMPLQASITSSLYQHIC